MVSRYVYLQGGRNVERWTREFGGSRGWERRWELGGHSMNLFRGSTYGHNILSPILGQAVAD